MDNDRRITLDRLKVGILAICFLLMSLCFWVLKPEWNGAAGSMLRIGVLLSVLWIALPTKKRPAAWAKVSPWTLAIIVGAIIFIAKTKNIFIVIPVLAILGFLSIFSHTRGGGNNRR